MLRKLFPAVLLFMCQVRTGVPFNLSLSNAEIGKTSHIWHSFTHAFNKRLAHFLHSEGHTVLPDRAQMRQNTQQYVIKKNNNSSFFFFWYLTAKFIFKSPKYYVTYLMFVYLA